MPETISGIFPAQFDHQVIVLGEGGEVNEIILRNRLYFISSFPPSR
jgi:hypothetical protein